MPPTLVARARAAERTAAVVSNAAVNAEYRHLVVACGRPATEAEPGQFFQLLCPAPADAAPFLRRPMSVYRVDEPSGRIEFLYKVTGAGTRGLATLRPGDALNVFGPLGRGFTLADGDRHVAVIGRGVGLATLAPLALAACRRGIAVTAFLSARSADLVMSREVLDAAGAIVVAVTDEDGTSAVDVLEPRLRALICDGAVDALYTCGSHRLLLLVQRLAADHGIRAEVALEQQMACGLGMCYCCVRTFRGERGLVHRRVCWDGPVFDAREALTW